MDEPVTDIKFVSSIDNCPKGYNIVTSCPCGHDAQLWEKVIGGEAGKRYICFTRDKNNDTVIEDMYIPSKTQQYLRRGYHIIKETVEGATPMYHKQLAVKSVPRTEAKKAVADIIVARSKDKISSIYTKTEKVNGLCICFRTMDYTYRLPPALAARHSTLTAGEKVRKRFEQTDHYKGGAGGRDLGKRFETMRVYDGSTTDRPRASTDVAASGHQFKVDLSSYAPSPPHSPGVLDSDSLPPYSEAVEPLAYKVKLTDYNPSPAFTEKSKQAGHHVGSDNGGPPSYSDVATEVSAPVPIGEVATANVSYSLASAPPPPPPSQHPSEAPLTSSSPLSTSSPYPAATSANATFNLNPISSYQPSPSIMQSYPPQQYHSYPPGPGPSTSSPATAPTAPAAGVGYNVSVQPTGYQPQPSQYPPTTHAGTAPPPSYNTSIGFQVGGAMGGATYPPPPSQPGYQSVAGTAFGQSGFSSSGQGPAPYNPYHQATGRYPPPPPPGSTQHNQSSGYGFKF